MADDFAKAILSTSKWSLSIYCFSINSVSILNPARPVRNVSNLHAILVVACEFESFPSLLTTKARLCAHTSLALEGSDLVDLELGCPRIKLLISFLSDGCHGLVCLLKGWIIESPALSHILPDCSWQGLLQSEIGHDVFRLLEAHIARKAGDLLPNCSFDFAFGQEFAGVFLR